MPGTVHEFGGSWTEEKLRRLKAYLKEYLNIFEVNEKAKFLTTHYVDAFAGCGERSKSSGVRNPTLDLFGRAETANVTGFYDGSARIALEMEPSFDYYHFIDSSPTFVEQLQHLKSEYPEKAHCIDVRRGDANTQIVQFCNKYNWRRHKAVVFLDPYGMAVDWSTISALGATNGVDLWVLLPIGQAVNRMLTRDGLPNLSWSDKLTRFFGTDEWKEAFYRPKLQASLFDNSDTESGLEKQANFESISNFFTDRLRTAFPLVAENSLMLRNSTNVPIFGLYFATSNQAGNRIASYILGR